MNVRVFDNMPLPTSGDNSIFVWIDFPPEIQEMLQTWGPWISSITAHTQTLQRTTNHSWKVGWYKGFDGVTWPANPTDLFTVAVVGNGAAVQTTNTNSADFTQAMRWAVGTKNTATSTVVENAIGSLGLVIELRT